MKKIMKIGAIALGLLLSAPGWSIMIGATDIGSIDQLLDVSAGSAVSSDADSLAWVNEYADPDFAALDTIVTVSYVSTNEPGVFAFDASSYDPGYFIIKNAQAAALYLNLADINWGVFDIYAIDMAIEDANILHSNEDFASITLGTDPFTISHITYSSTPTTPDIPNTVPEPGALALLGMGLVGIGMVRRKK